MNKQGNLILIDEGQLNVTKIKVEQSKGFRLNAGDFIDLGLEQTLFVVSATSEKKPTVSNN